MEFSLFYFSGNGSRNNADKYNLLIESAKFADRNNFSAIWTPERHFHPFGGLYPNPSLTSMALAMITNRVQLRAGSVVMPLHNPARVAEEWSMVDNFSNGRVGLAFASGWTIDDFVLSRQSHANRKETMWQGIEEVQQLWQGQEIELKDATGRAFNIRTFPRPIQSKLPTWIVCQSSATYIEAGKLGANVLTSLLGGTLEEVAPQISLYRKSLEQNGYDSKVGKVAIMIHTFVGENYDATKEAARQPFYNYLKTHINLLESLAKDAGVEVDLEKFTEADLNSLLQFAYEGWLNGRTLIGSQKTCMQMVERLKKAGVDEVACLIDFNDNFDAVMASLPHLKDLKNMCNLKKEAAFSS
ncbi:LLM class flavin-dependent oxidoreductase [Myxosarcina sp. GI1(2024)]